MKKDIKIQNVLLFLIFIALLINAFVNMSNKTATAETFKTDDCITTQPSDKPLAYLHVVTH